MTKPTKKLTHWPNGNIELEAYRVGDKLHRTDGPTSIWYYENGNIKYEAYWVDNKELTKEEFESRNYPKTNNSPSNKCECGANSIGSSFHSTWCQLYNKG